MISFKSEITAEKKPQLYRNQKESKTIQTKKNRI